VPIFHHDNQDETGTHAAIIEQLS